MKVMYVRKNRDVANIKTDIPVEAPLLQESKMSDIFYLVLKFLYVPLTRQRYVSKKKLSSTECLPTRN